MRNRFRSCRTGSQWAEESSIKARPRMNLAPIDTQKASDCSALESVRRRVLKSRYQAEYFVPRGAERLVQICHDEKTCGATYTQRVHHSRYGRPDLSFSVSPVFLIMSMSLTDAAMHSNRRRRRRRAGRSIWKSILVRASLFLGSLNEAHRSSVEVRSSLY